VVQVSISNHSSTNVATLSSAQIIPTGGASFGGSAASFSGSEEDAPTPPQAFGSPFSGAGKCCTTVAIIPDPPNCFAGVSGGASIGGTPTTLSPSSFVGPVKPPDFVDGVGSGDDEGVWKSDDDDTDDEEMTVTTAARTTPSRTIEANEYRAAVRYSLDLRCGGYAQ
jgi:hypothetical protein